MSRCCTSCRPTASLSRKKYRLYHRQQRVLRQQYVLHVFWVEPVPAGEYGGVQRTEVVLHGHVVVDCSGGRQCWVGTDDTGFDAVPEIEYRRCGAMVGAPAGVAFDAAAEFGKGHAHDPVLDLQKLH